MLLLNGSKYRGNYNTIAGEGLEGLGGEGTLLFYWIVVGIDFFSEMCILPLLPRQDLKRN